MTGLICYKDKVLEAAYPNRSMQKFVTRAELPISRK